MAKKIDPLVLKITTEGGSKAKADVASLGAEVVKSGEATKKAATGATQFNKAINSIDGKPIGGVAKEMEKVEAATASARKQVEAARREINDVLKGASNSFTGTAQSGFGGGFLGSLMDAKGALSGGGNPFTGFLDEAKSFGDQVKETIDALKELKESKDEAASDSGGDSGGGDVPSLADSLAAASDKAEELSNRAEGVRNFGLALAGAGAAGIALTKSLAKKGGDAIESESLVETTFGANTKDIRDWSEKRRDSLGANDYDQRRQAASFQSQFLAADLSPERAMALSKAFTEMKDDYVSFKNIADPEVFAALQSGINGESEPLRRLSIFMSDAAIKAYALQKGIGSANEELTEQEKVAARAGFILEQFKKSAASGDLERTKDSPANIKRRAEAMAELSNIELGKGAANVEAIIDSLKMKLIGIIGLSPELAATAGTILGFGSYAAAGIGSVIALGGQVAQLSIAWRLHQAAQAASAAAADTNAAAQAASAGASTGAGGAAVGAAAANQTLTAAELEAAAAAEVQAAAATAAGNANAAAGAKAGLAATAFSLAGMAAAGIGVAIGAAMAAGIYWIGQATGALDKHRSMQDSVADGWNRVKDAFTGGNTAAFGVTQRDLETEVAKVDAENSAAVLKKTKTQEQAEKDSLDRKIALYEKFAQEQLKSGDTANMTANQQKAAQLRQQQNIGAVAGIPTSAPSPGAAASTGTTPMMTAPSAPSGDGMVSTSGPSSENIALQIRNLEGQKAAAKGKANADLRDALTAQIRNLRVQGQNAKKSERDAARAEKVEDSDDLALSKAKNDIESSSRIEGLQGQLDAAREAGNAAEIGRLTLAIEIEQARKKYNDAMAAAAQEEAGKHRSTLEQIAKLQFDADKNRAQAAANKARSSVEKSDGKTKASGKKQPTQAEINALFNATGAGGGPLAIAGFQALDPTGQMGSREGRFMQSENDHNGNAVQLMDSLWTGGAVPRMRQGIGSLGDFGGMERSRADRQQQRTARARVSENGRGETIIKFEEIRLPANDFADIPVD
jgi:hypothetical protein